MDLSVFDKFLVYDVIAEREARLMVVQCGMDIWGNNVSETLRNATIVAVQWAQINSYL